MDLRNPDTRRRVLLTTVVVAVVAAMSVVLLFGIRAAIQIHAMLNPQFRHVQTSELKWLARPMSVTEAWNDTRRQFRTSIPAKPGSWTNFADASGTYLFIGDQDMVLMVLVPANASVHGGGFPPMRLAISSLVNHVGEAGAAIPQTQGIPAIVCDLNQTQTDYVWSNDVPPSLVTALKDAARQANWTPFSPNGGMVPATPKPVVVPAGAHFPAEVTEPSSTTATNRP